MQENEKKKTGLGKGKQHEGKMGSQKSKAVTGITAMK